MASDYDLKNALPNKSYNEDGTTTDLLGNPVVNPVIEYENKPSLPNKWLNPDGSYSTLLELISGAIDTELFIVVEQLPATGETNKIYLLVDGDNLIEYLWTGSKWDPIGMIQFDLSQYSTTDQMNAAIAASLNSAKAYADVKKAEAISTSNMYTDNAIANFVPLRAFPNSVVTNQSTTTFFNSIKSLNLPVGSMMLGLVTLTDMPVGLIQAEVRIEVYENNVLYGVMRSADLSPYVWEANSYDYRGWEPEGSNTLSAANSYTDSQCTSTLNSAKSYADTKKSEAITSANGYTDTQITAAEQYADSVASSAETSAKSYADTKASAAQTAAVSSANSYTDTAIQTSITQVLGGSY